MNNIFHICNRKPDNILIYKDKNELDGYLRYSVEGLSCTLKINNCPFCGIDLTYLKESYTEVSQIKFMDVKN